MHSDFPETKQSSLRRRAVHGVASRVNQVSPSGTVRGKEQVSLLVAGLQCQPTRREARFIQEGCTRAHDRLSPTSPPFPKVEQALNSLVKCQLTPSGSSSNAESTSYGSVGTGHLVTNECMALTWTRSSPRTIPWRDSQTLILQLQVPAGQ